MTARPSIPLSVLDLAPISSGATPAQALQNTLQLARLADALGYHRYWLAEHHLSDGLACSATPVVIGQVAAATARIRVGSGATLLGYQTPLSVAENFGTLDAFFPGRIDLGLGRGAASPRRTPAEGEPWPEARVVRGLLIPSPPVPVRQVAARRREGDALLRLPGAQPLGFAESVERIFGLIEGVPGSQGEGGLRATPGERAQLQIWVLGSSAGESASVAAARGLPFAANYHVSPATVLDAVEAYRSAFRPSATLSRPHVMVSADVVVADDDARARDLAQPYGAWVQSIRKGAGAIPYPSARQARAISLEDALVRDRIDTQFVGSPETVVRGLETLCEATGADELVITTNAHRHADRLRSYALLWRAWRRR
jgi:alkanesulfonate monooxygenase SsuD/methylene tetrahydromethanopterin reductase-like flavin-dependent oxidoreductase (luciferase family)